MLMRFFHQRPFRCRACQVRFYRRYKPQQVAV